jgi:hypothetical protein
MRPGSSPPSDTFDVAGGQRRLEDEVGALRRLAIDANDGVVTFDGPVGPLARELSKVLARAVPGVVEVHWAPPSWTMPNASSGSSTVETTMATSVPCRLRECPGVERCDRGDQEGGPPGRLGVGATYRQVRSVPRRSEEEFEVTVFEPASRLEVRGSSGPSGPG